MNDPFKAVSLGEYELTLESYHYKEILTIPLQVFRKFTDYWKNFNKLRLVHEKTVFQQNSKATDIKMI